MTVWALLDDDGEADTLPDDELDEEEAEDDTLLAPVVVAVVADDEAAPVDAAPVAITATKPPNATADVAAATRRARAAG